MRFDNLSPRKGPRPEEQPEKQQEDPHRPPRAKLMGANEGQAGATRRGAEQARARGERLADRKDVAERARASASAQPAEQARQRTTGVFEQAAEPRPARDAQSIGSQIQSLIENILG